MNNLTLLNKHFSFCIGTIHTGGIVSGIKTFDVAVREATELAAEIKTAIVGVWIADHRGACLGQPVYTITK